MDHTFDTSTHEKLLKDIRETLQGISDEDLHRLYPGMSREEFLSQLQKDETSLLALLRTRPAAGSGAGPAAVRWFDKPLSGLSKEGQEHLNELTEQLHSLGGSSHVDQKQLRYLKQLRKMRLTVPEFYRSKVEPKAFYRHLVDFCQVHDIPAEIVHRVVPALVDYLETGHMRPIIFVGEKGCGKTTAVHLLAEEALHLPTYVIKVPQMSFSHGMTGTCGSYQSADAGCLAKAQLRADSLLVAYVFDEIDKAVHDSSHASVEDELLSITDESCCDVYDNYLESRVVALEHCPIFMTANDIQKVSPLLADRCTVIQFPNADAARIKSISHKYIEQKQSGPLYRMIRFDYDQLDAHIDKLSQYGITSLRKHQQMIEAVLDCALNEALVQEDSNDPVSVTEAMLADAEQSILGTVKHRTGFIR